MPCFDSVGKLLMVVGGSLFFFGALITFGSRLFPFGRLPGDILVQRGNFTFYFPIFTCIILSIILSLIMRFFRR
ncbi:MAG: DUF2905 domain-containing protein [bacterium]|jgi:hypothetical protein|nr:DUF2905 domain-containing protein [Bacillota bacterium]